MYTKTKEKKRNKTTWSILITKLASVTHQAISSYLNIPVEKMKWKKKSTVGYLIIWTCIFFFTWKTNDGKLFGLQKKKKKESTNAFENFQDQNALFWKQNFVPIWIKLQRHTKCKSVREHHDFCTTNKCKLKYSYTTVTK